MFWLGCTRMYGCVKIVCINFSRKSNQDRENETNSADVSPFQLSGSHTTSIRVVDMVQDASNSTLEFHRFCQCYKRARLFILFITRTAKIRPSKITQITPPSVCGVPERPRTKAKKTKSTTDFPLRLSPTSCMPPQPTSRANAVTVNQRLCFV